jgi:dipeptidyl aminopeptidase/acylaminoacyl peptidase
MHRLSVMVALFAVVVQLSVLGWAAVAMDKRAITEKDLFAFTWIGDVQVAPDGSAVAYVQTTVAKNREGYETAIYVLDLKKAGAGPELFAEGAHDSTPRWSPDGKAIAFLRSPAGSGKTGDGKAGPPQLYLKALAGQANPIKLTEMAKGVSNPAWSPKGDGIAVVSLTPQDQEKAKLEAVRRARATGDDAHESDVRIINREVYRFNGEGFLDPSLVPQIYLISLPKADGTQAAPWQITGGRFGVEEYVWGPESERLYYTSDREEEPYYDAVEHNSIYGVDVKGGESHGKDLPATTFTADLKIEAHGLAVAHDGKWIAFHAEDLPAPPARPVSHQQNDLWLMELKAGAAPRDLTAAQSYEMGGSVGGDNTAPRGAGRPAIAWSTDDGTAMDVAAKDGSALLVRVDMNAGAVTEMTRAKQAVVGFSASVDAKTVVALISNPIAIGDLFAVGDAQAQTQLTHVNDALFSQLDLKMPEELQVTPTSHAGDVDGHAIDTFVQLPPGFQEGKKYPAILNIHGGPHSAYGWVFDHEMLRMAARGYVVVYPNPRGSTSYGQKFANVIQDNYPNNDFHDLMDSVDAVVKKGWADPDKLDVTGGSGGGLLTDWTVTQTNRFKAAVAQRDIVDWAGWWYTADIGEFHQFWMKPAPFDNLQAYHDRSPLTFVNNIKTPMMFILGDADYRTPPTAGGEMFFRALKYKKIPTVMVRFPRESHELSRSGEPWHRVERLENIVGWFDKYLMGMCEPQYDVAPVANAGCRVK